MTRRQLSDTNVAHVARSIVDHGWADAAMPWAEYGPFLAQSPLAHARVVAMVRLLRKAARTAQADGATA